MAKSNRGGGNGIEPIFGLLFGGLFAAVGFGTLFLLILPTLLEGYVARDWPQRWARLESTELVEVSGDDSTSYRVEATYRYEVDGTEHIGDRVGLMSGSDNLGDWHQRWHARLSEHLEQDEPIAVYVDPLEPARAVLDPKIRWGQLAFLMIFPVVFGGVGVVVIVITRPSRPPADRKAFVSRQR